MVKGVKTKVWRIAEGHFRALSAAGDGDVNMGLSRAVELLKNDNKEARLARSLFAVAEEVGQSYPPARAIVEDVNKRLTFPLALGRISPLSCYDLLNFISEFGVEQCKHIIAEWKDRGGKPITRTMRKEVTEISETRGPASPAESDLDSEADSIMAAKPAKETRSPKTVYPAVK
ncbi:MAG: hypothetical protein PHH26_01925 [Candidatus Thermoplasmatota archaeon]|nr:hypothetical protein [Candidatus Thermoplasmatota archaeon]